MAMAQLDFGFGVGIRSGIPGFESHGFNIICITMISIMITIPIVDIITSIITIIFNIKV